MMGSSVIARQTTVSASSTLRRLAVETPAETFPLASNASLLLPISTELRQLDLLVDVKQKTTLQVEVWSTGKLCPAQA